MLKVRYRRYLLLGCVEAHVLSRELREHLQPTHLRRLRGRGRRFRKVIMVL
jgi:hypothetical protein